MTTRQKFFKAVKRETGDYVPFELRLCPFLEKKFVTKSGLEDYPAYFGMPLRFVTAPVRKRDDNFSRYFLGTDKAVDIDVWGVGHIKGDLQHFTRMVHPMESFDKVEDFITYPYPDPDHDFDWEYIQARVKELSCQDLVSYGFMPFTIFEISWYLRGLENLLSDMILNHEMVEYHLDRITGIRCEMAREYALAGVDVLFIGDDVATQLNMMMSGEMWRKYLKPRLKKVIDTAKSIKSDILIDYHSDGNIQEIISDLVEVGIDILNPVQPECMDPVKIKEIYGDRLSFRGTVGTQTTMPFGTTDDVKRVCIEMIHKVGENGGLILAPTHILEPEVPWENIETLVETVREYNEAHFIE